MKIRGVSIALGSIVCMAASGHEPTDMIPTLRALHMEFHRVSTSYPLVDQMNLKESHDGAPRPLLWYFDVADSHLYRCWISNEDGFCAPKDATVDFAWGISETQYGRSEGLVPVERRSGSTIYMLDSETPLAQTTTWVWYTGRGRVVRCRTTITEYTFEASTAQGTLFIDSDKAPKVSRECSQVFPK